MSAPTRRLAPAVTQFIYLDRASRGGRSATIVGFILAVALLGALLSLFASQHAPRIARSVSGDAQIEALVAGGEAKERAGDLIGAQADLDQAVAADPQRAATY